MVNNKLNTTFAIKNSSAQRLFETFRDHTVAPRIPTSMTFVGDPVRVTEIKSPCSLTDAATTKSGMYRTPQLSSNRRGGNKSGKRALYVALVAGRC